MLFLITHHLGAKRLQAELKNDQETCRRALLLIITVPEVDIVGFIHTFPVSRYLFRPWRTTITAPQSYDA